jgi:hypothetical protein
VGHTGREFFEGSYNKFTGFYHLTNAGIEQEVEVISGDEYMIQLVNYGEKMLGKNYNPRNFKGSLYALRVPKRPPVLAVNEPEEDIDLQIEPPADSKVKEEVKNPKISPPVVVAPDAPVVPPAKPEPADTLPRTDFSGRTILTKESMPVTRKQVRIEIWDQTIVDGDVVSLSWNGRPLLDHYMVRREHKTLLLDLQKGENLLIMHAENLGRIPPNTAAIAVYRGDEPEVYILNSDLGKSEAIRFTRD